MADEPKVVSAVGTSANSSLHGGVHGKARAAAIEKAMAQAVADASAQGLNIDKDAAKVKALMLEYRQRVIDTFAPVAQVPEATTETEDVSKEA